MNTLKMKCGTQLCAVHSSPGIGFFTPTQYMNYRKFKKENSAYNSMSKKAKFYYWLGVVLILAMFAALVIYVSGKPINYPI